MELNKFVREEKDTDETWKDSFQKYDCVWVADGDDFPELYERFKCAIAEHLFDLRFGRTHFFEHIESFYRIRFSDHDTGCADALKAFLEEPARPIYCHAPDQFLRALRTFAEERQDGLGVDIEVFCKATSELFRVLESDIRGVFVHFECEDPKEAARQELIQMTGQVGEILATLFFQQIRGCGALVQAKIDLDNTNMPRHGENLLAFVFDPTRPEQDELFFVEAKSSKDSISEAVEEIRDRFTGHLQQLPIYDVVRLKRHITREIGGKLAEPVRGRISDLLWKAKLQPGSLRLRFSPFLHYPAEYRPRDTTLKKLGDIKFETDGRETKAAPSQIHVIVFQFVDFEESVREIFKRAWTI